MTFFQSLHNAHVDQLSVGLDHLSEKLDIFLTIGYKHKRKVNVLVPTLKKDYPHQLAANVSIWHDTNVSR